jgi:hypothetical protein
MERAIDDESKNYDDSVKRYVYCREVRTTSTHRALLPFHEVKLNRIGFLFISAITVTLKDDIQNNKIA